MIYTIIIVLIVVLILFAIIITAFQQHREKEEANRRAELNRLKAVVEDTESAILNACKIPISPNLLLLLSKRVVTALKDMFDLNPQSQEIKRRLSQAAERLTTNQSNEGGEQEVFVVPDNERQVIELLQGVKKLRVILNTENAKGNIDPQIFITEDRRLERLQLRINIESLSRRAHAAKTNNMLGSARQYLEKILAIIDTQTSIDEYTANKKTIVEQQLEEIMGELRNANAASRKKKIEDETNELDVLFQPKKKW